MARKIPFRFPVSTLIGSYFINFIKIVSGKKVHKKFRSRFLFTAIISGILDPFGKIETLIKSKEVSKTKIDEPPIFIIGFWRSGTTYLHNLMCLDSNHAFVSTYQSIFPSHSLINSFWLKKLATMAMPKERPVDKVSLNMDFPQEEEMALGNTQKISFYNYFYFPDDLDELTEETLYFKNVKKKDIDNWREKYLLIIKKAMIMTGGKRFVSKNPPNTFRIPQLLKTFPEAKFIYLYRNPYKVLSSFILFMSQVIEGVGFQKPNVNNFENGIFNLFKKALNKYEQDKSLIPGKNLFEIKYEDFMEEPVKTIDNIYTQFNLDNTEEFSDKLNKFISSQKHHKSGGHFIPQSLKDFVNKNLEDYMKRHKYSN